MSTVAPHPEAAERKAEAPRKRQFINFAVYKVDRQWRLLPVEARERGKVEFERVICRFNESKRCQVLTYTTMGMRADGDFLLWVISHDLEAVQELATAIANTTIGAYLFRQHSFLSMTKRSIYLDRLNPEHAEDRVHILPGKYKYIFVYPFVKKRDWYVLPMEKRQEMMDEHIRIGNKYPTVKLNTSYSFGLDDQDFVVAFESDHPQDFLDLVMELRESAASMYTLRDTPIITAISQSVRDMLDSLGG